jgi:NAD(P)H dehydrogenase (quinone)
MKVLVITSNPETGSLTNAVAESFAHGAEVGGAHSELLDLYAIGFNPVYSNQDRQHYLGKSPVPEDVAALHAKLVEADVIALVFPIYWYTMPAMMKGFFDRVVCRGFAYRKDGLPGALAGKRVRIFALSGGAEDWYKASGMDKALQFQICDRTFKHYCGVEDVAMHYVDGLTMGDDSPEARQQASAKLRQVTLIGEKLATDQSR